MPIKSRRDRGYGSSRRGRARQSSSSSSSSSSMSSSSSSSLMYAAAAAGMMPTSTGSATSTTSSTASSSTGLRQRRRRVVRGGAKRRGRRRASRKVSRASRARRRHLAGGYHAAMHRRNSSSASGSYGPSSSESSSMSGGMGMGMGWGGGSGDGRGPNADWDEVVRGGKRRGGKKVVVFVRHAEAIYNVLPSEDSDPLDWDAGLTAHGKHQAKVNSKMARELSGHGLSPELIVVSPLTRTLQTMERVFKRNIAKGTPVLVEALAREKLSGGADVGNSPSTLAKKFPRYRFGHLPTVWWYTPRNKSYKSVSQARAGFRRNPDKHREPDSVFEARARKWKRWLASRPESVIAVVSHGDITWELVGGYVKNTEFVTCILDNKSAELSVMRWDTRAPKATHE